MERQEQTGLRKQEEAPREREAERRRPQADRQSPAVLAARAALAGAPLWDLPPRTLEELAARVGNHSLLELAARGAPEADTAPFRPPADEGPDTPPFPVPGGLDCPLAAPAGLSRGWSGPPADPAGLAP